MQLLNAREVPLERPRTGHRGGGLFFRRLFQGTRRAKNNYEVAIGKTESTLFRSPRHRHNFDQIRVGLSGLFGDGKGLDVGPGQVIYYPEGVYYEINSKDAEILILQFGGAGSEGYPSYDDLFEAYPEMAKIGTFRDGIFFRTERENLAPGEKKNMDGYEALWQHIFKRPVVYPKPRYREPIFMDSANYRWTSDPAEPGVRRKLLGVFTERWIEIGQVEVSPGATYNAQAPAFAPRFVFAQSGTGESPAGAWKPWSIVRLEGGESLPITARETLLLWSITLPGFRPEEL